MICTCNREMDVIQIGLQKIYTCDYCMTYDIEFLECEHKNFKPIQLTMSNGAIMVKNYCTDCLHTFGNPIKKSLVNFKNIHKTTNENYHKWRSLMDVQEKNYINEITAGRNNVRLVFMKNDYSEYLNSDEWKNKRKKILERDSYVCQICHNVAECVHHLTYKHIKNEYFFELISLCDNCHIEYYHPEQKKLHEV